MTPLALAPAAVFGLLIGSFLNVVAWRVPRGESIVTPGSHCPSCGVALRPWDNIPLLSWLLLRGRCRNCGARISARYPLVEFATAALYVAIVAVLWGQWREVTLGLVLVTFLVPLTLIDFEHRRLPNALTGPAALLAIPIGLITEPSFVVEQLIAGAAALAFFLIPALLSRRGMGMGDAKLGGVLGLYLGASVAPAFLIALVAGTLCGIIVIFRKGMAGGRKTALPFGPFLALGAVVCLFVGPDLLDLYTQTFSN